MISAPAGFGKSTLLSQWVAERRRPAAWLWLEEADNAPGRFWTYVCDALAPFAPEAAEATKAGLDGPRVPPAETLLLPLLNGLTSSPTDVILILDDYQVIRTPEIHQAVTFLVEHMPPALHLVLICRADPPLPLARWRARGEMVEVRAQDLRFTLGEAAAFLNGARRLGLTDELVDALYQRTEGWVTGLQLAALLLKERKDAAGFVAAFAGSHRYVLDYLVEEVLSRQPEQLQQFLLQTSVLHRLSSPLCEALTGMADSQQLLRALEEADLFLLPLDEAGEWYRYHHLFADMLRAHLQLQLPGRWAELHLRASDWFAAEGLTGDAIHHAIAAQDWGRAADLLESGAETAWAGGELRDLLAWLKALPATTLRDRPRLCLLYARTLIPTGRAGAIEALIADAEAGLTAEVAGEVTAMRAQLARLRGEIPQAMALARQALAELPPAARGWRGLTEIALGGCHRLCGELEEALQAYSRGAADCAAVGNAFLSLTGLLLQAEVYEQRGELRRAAAAFRGVAQKAPRHSPIAGWAMVGEGGILCEWDQLDQAAGLLTRGIELGRAGQMINAVVPGYLHLSRVRLAQGDLPEAIRLTELAAAEARSSGIGRAIARVIPWQVALLLAQGDVAGAAAALPGGTEAPACEVARARVKRAAGVPDEALTTLSPVLEQLRRSGETALSIEALIVAALCRSDVGDRKGAAMTLQEAQELGAPGGFARIFLDEGSALEALLEQSRRVGAPGLVEALSERELEVLRLVEAGATNQEIGQRLFVSVNTVKKHTTNIFGKLGVSSRTQALTRARELGLL